MQDYYRIAVELKNGQGFNSTIRAPFYPYLLSLLFLLFDSSNLIVIKIFQSFISLLNVILIYFLGKEAFDRRTGLLAAGLFCFYPTLLFYNNFILTEVIFIFLFTAFLLVFVLYLNNRKIRYLVFSGLLLGLTTLCRSVTLQLPVFLGVYLLFLKKSRAWVSDTVKRCLTPMVFFISFILILLPWTIRNYKVHHALIPVDLIGKINVMLGNYEYTPLNRAWDAHITQTSDRSWSYPLRKEGLYDKMTEAERADWAFRVGVKFMIQHPMLTFKRSFVKFCNFWELERVPGSMAVKGFLGNSNLAMLKIFAALGCLLQSLILFGAIFSLVYFFKNNAVTNSFFLLIVTYFTLIHSIIYGHPRYQLPLAPILFICGANAFLCIAGVWKQRQWVKFSFATSICLFFVLVCARQFYIHLNNLYLID